MTQTKLLKDQVDYLTSLLRTLDQSQTLIEKLQVLEREILPIKFFQSNHPINDLYASLSPVEKYAIVSILVIGQGPFVFHIPKRLSEFNSKFNHLLTQLTALDRFYKDIGGLIGYHYQVLRLLYEQKSKSYEKRVFHQAPRLDITKKDERVRKAIIDGIKNLPHLGELYPIGGAGDRLDLKDEKTGIALPTAKLMFLGRSLLTGLVRDLQAREYVYYKLFGQQITTPVAMMTSEAKNNHQFVNEICEKNQWFHRPKSSFFPFMQPLAPVLTIEGNWSMQSPLQLYLKPSGHGVLWKIAQEKGVLNWFSTLHREKILIRQINNPVAGIDDGLFPLLGIGCSENKSFGFASCDRRVHNAEGVNILCETQKEGKSCFSISNIEYTDFDKNGIEDRPEKEGGEYSIFPSNTNILFVDIASIPKAIKNNPIPGMLINMKAEVPFINEKGQERTLLGGRLESTMQNIADELTDCFEGSTKDFSSLPLQTFLTYNKRHKTISATKKSYKPKSPIYETPEGSYYTLLINQKELLETCKFNVPNLPTHEDFIEKGPSFHFIYHPALGPFYQIIQQKLRSGKISPNSEWQLEITEVDVENLDLKGSLQILCDQPLGHLDDENFLHYSDQTGRCTLHNVKVKNAGIDYEKQNQFWKNQIHRKESLVIKLGRQSEFYAENVTFEGSFDLHVPDFTKMVVREENGQLVIDTYSIQHPSWRWQYFIDDQNTIQLKKHIF